MSDPPHTITERRAERLRQVIGRRQWDLHLVIENVHDPHNVAAVLRTCDAVGVGTVHLIYTVDRLPDEYSRPDAGVWKWVERVWHDSVQECYDWLHSRGVKVYATDMNPEKAPAGLYETDLTGPVALVFGNEHRGVSEAASSMADGNILIPMAGFVQSLNISVACAVALYEALRQRMNAGKYDTPQLDPAGVEAVLADWAGR